jgi:CheY-like chemotaxis protein
MAKVNILVADHNNSCAFFLKSLLQPQGFGVSMSFSPAETMTKLSTGLFDTVLFDLNDTGAQTLRTLCDINQLLPGMPLVLIQPPDTRLLDGVDVFLGIEKPIRLGAFADAMRSVRDAVTALDNRRICPRKEVNLPAEICAGGRTIFCRATNLSAGGMQVETMDRTRVRRGLEALLIDKDRGPILVRLFLGRHQVWEFNTSVAYVERCRFQSPEQVGLAFTAMSDRQKKELDTFLAPAR